MLVPLEAIEIADTSDEALVQINAALEKLAQLDERLALVVECRFFAGYGERKPRRC